MNDSLYFFSHMLECTWDCFINIGLLYNQQIYVQSYLVVYLEIFFSHKCDVRVVVHQSNVEIIKWTVFLVWGNIV